MEPFRYTLTRRTGFGDRTVLFVMLNPSTATDEVNDPTITRCVGYAQTWGFGWLKVGNLSPMRATDPKDMLRMGPESPVMRSKNDDHILAMAKESDLVVAAWGTHGPAERRSDHMKGLLMRAGVDVYCLGLTKDGEPLHPLMQPKDAVLQPFLGEGLVR